MHGKRPICDMHVTFPIFHTIGLLYLFCVSIRLHTSTLTTVLQLLTVIGTVTCHTGLWPGTGCTRQPRCVAGWITQGCVSALDVRTVTKITEGRISQTVSLSSTDA